MEVPPIAPSGAVTWGSLTPPSGSEAWKTPRGWKIAIYSSEKSENLWDLPHKNFSFGSSSNMEDRERLNMERREDF